MGCGSSNSVVIAQQTTLPQKDKIAEEFHAGFAQIAVESETTNLPPSTNVSDFEPNLKLAEDIQPKICEEKVDKQIIVATKSEIQKDPSPSNSNQSDEGLSKINSSENNLTEHNKMSNPKDSETKDTENVTNLTQKETLPKQIETHKNKIEKVESDFVQTSNLPHDTSSTIDGSLCSDVTDDGEFAENILCDVIVGDVIGSLTSFPVEGESAKNVTVETSEAAQTNNNTEGNDHDKTIEVLTEAKKQENQDSMTLPTNQDTNSKAEIKDKLNEGHIEATAEPAIVKTNVPKHVAIIPSAGPTHVVCEYIETESDLKLLSAMRIACSVTSSNHICSLATKASSLHLHKSLPFVSRIVASMQSLTKLDVSGNNSGPVAVRTLLSLLASCGQIEQLDFADNMADSECAEFIGRFIRDSTKLRWLNLSGNQFGKESLNKVLSASISLTNSLTYLDISSCGAINLHGLFEAMRKGYSQNSLQLKYLDVSNNTINDGLQLGIDLSLILESETCRLQTLNISSVGLKAAGFEALMAGIKSNSSLIELLVGGAENNLKDFSALVQLLFAARNLCKVSLKAIKCNDDSFTDNFPTFASCNITELDLNNCGLTNNLLKNVAKSSPGTLCNVEKLNISNNVDLTQDGIEYFRDLCGDNLNKVTELSLAGMDIEYLPHFLKSCCLNLQRLDLRKCRIPADMLAEISSIPQSLTHLVLDGIKISKTAVLDNLMGLNSPHRFEKLSLANCGLVDADLMVLSDTITRLGPPLQTLSQLDLSSNRLTEGWVLSLVKNLMATKNHPLTSVDLSNNQIKDAGAISLSEAVLSASAASNIANLSLANNLLTSAGIKALTSTLRLKTRGILLLDVSNQKQGLNEDEIDEVMEMVASTLGFDGEVLNQNVPDLSHKINLNLTKLGGSIGERVKAFNSVAIKTDFDKVCRGSAGLGDYLQIGAGIQQNSSENSREKPAFTTSEWKTIVGSDSPAWLQVDGDRRSGVYINHLPGTATVQRLEGILEMEADCEVKEVYLVKDPIMRKPTGAAWVLFTGAESVDKAMSWFSDGEAVMYGTAFSVSRIDIEIIDEKEGAQIVAKRELLARENERRKAENEDREMMDESQRLADERAAYREAHPAYQNGRIW